jgi:Putative auto-transporter adhesin, head GIN domain
MKNLKALRIALAIPFLAVLLTSCLYEEDPGPIQELEKEYAILDFDRLEMGDAFVITVEQSDIFSVNVRGDRRNLDDLDVDKIGTTLRIRFRHHENRQYATYITVTMPYVKGINFSGATTSTVTGFTEIAELDFTLSGASVSQLNIASQQLRLNLSGASKLTATGHATSLQATVSGASIYSGFGLTADDAIVDASGASKINVMAATKLNATASGASMILYRGTPTVNSSVSGASSIQAD